MASLPLQIKKDSRLPVRGEPAAFSIDTSDDVTSLAIDGRRIPIAAYDGAPLEDIARRIARVPAALRSSLSRLVVSDAPNPSDAEWASKYKLPVLAGMSATAAGRITIYPHGLEQLRLPDPDVFVRGLMHELGHSWSMREWTVTGAAKDAWLDAIARDPSAPSQYAKLSFENSGLPFEDAAEATALYFLVLGTSDFETYRKLMPARFSLLRARFANA